jgi:ketosteroid isomerase-like protein
MAGAVRTPIGPRARLPRRRTLEEKLFVRWPRAYAAFARAAGRLPPRSRLRRALLRRNALSGWGAWLRQDFELMLLRFAPDHLYEPPREWIAAGMRSAYHGHAGLLEWTADMREAWDWLENMPVEVVDVGNPVVFINRIRLRARGSGVEFDYRAGLVIWVENGLIVRESDFLDSEEALAFASRSGPGSERRS